MAQREILGSSPVKSGFGPQAGSSIFGITQALGFPRVLALSFRCWGSGLPKSIPTTENGADCSTQRPGNGVET
ncbi:hypothetical protein TNCV_2370791 [Trichonephila clavipes]|nr:hypothetical protein TNCV_2370791 [Trichonephila clavipes]